MSGQQTCKPWRNGVLPGRIVRDFRMKCWGTSSAWTNFRASRGTWPPQLSGRIFARAVRLCIFCAKAYLRDARLVYFFAHYPLSSNLTQTFLRPQVRNLVRLVSAYASESADFCRWLRLCVLASTAGLYPGAKERSLAARRRMFSFFGGMSPLQFQQWLKEGYQSLCLFVVKEYLTWCAAHCPAIEAELHHRYKWGAFRASVVSATEEARAMLEAGKTFQQVDAYLLGVNKSQVKHMFKQRRRTFVEALDGLVQKEVQFPTPDAMYHAIIRWPHEDISLLKLDATEALVQMQENYSNTFVRANLKALVVSLPPVQQAVLRLYLNMVKRANSVRVFTLPLEWTERQTMALRRVYGTDSLPSHAGSCCVCHVCKSFKSFVSDPRHPRSLTCYGNSKLLIDDDTMQLFCGRKHERHEQSACSSTPVVGVRLVGRILLWWGSLYTVCPCCANFMRFNPAHHSREGVYCGLCLADSGILKSELKCEWCHSKRNLTRVMTTDKSIRLCRTCHRPWIRSATTLLSLETIQEGLRCKWKTLPG